MYLKMTVFGLILVAGLNMFRNQDETDSLNEHLKVFQPMVGKTFVGEFANSTPEKPLIDVSRWERAMNGQAVRVLHSVNDGEYGGETILMWDRKLEKIAFWYFTTAGFYTTGTMDIDGNTWSATEEVTGNKQGITQVKSVSTIQENGEMHIKTEYLTNGEWTLGRDMTYRPSTEAEVKFR